MSNNLLYLEELLRKAQNIILPTNSIDDVKYVLNKKIKKTCFLSVKFKDIESYCIPICNRYEFIDPKIIQFSIDLIDKKLIYNLDIDQIDLQQKRKKLKKLFIKYSKNLPKPISMAILKSKSTRRFKKELGIK